MTSKKLLQQTVGLTLVVLFLVGCGGAQAEPTATPVPPIQHISDIKVGMPKNDVIESLGKPNEWVTITSDMQASIATLFDLESTKRSMPSGEVWLFEYTLPNEGTFTVHFLDNEVVDVVEGSVLEE